MSANLLLDTSSLEILIRNHKVSLHLLKGLGSNGINSEGLLTLGETEPQLSPGRMSRALAEDLGHGSAAVASGERRLIGIER